MKDSDKNNQLNRNVSEDTIFPIAPKFLIEMSNENIVIQTNTKEKPSKDEIINQACNYHAQGNISEAIKFYKYCINKGYNDYRIFSNYGIIVKELGKFEEALNYYNKALELKPDLAEAYINLGNIFRDLGKLKDAEIATRKAIECNPDFAIAHSNLGTILKDLGNIEESHLCFIEANSLDKDLDAAIRGIGEIQLKRGDFTNGIVNIRKANGSINFNYKNPKLIIQ